MNKAFILGVLAYLLPTFPLGYFWHLVTFAEQYHRLDIYRAEVIIPLGLSTMIIQGVFFSWVYPKLFSTARRDWLVSACKFAAVFAVLAWSFTTLPVAAKFRMTSISDFLLLETTFTLLQFTVVAPLMALAHRDR
ncbi:MAG: hypothetical protein ABL931_02095 [Usitatibacteraceae bacterium]